MERTVELREFPAGLEIPGDLRDRFRYDSSQACLCFRGFMSKAVFDQLVVLSSDRAYRRALEELFRRCCDDGEAKPARRLSWAMLASVTAAIVILVCGGVWFSHHRRVVAPPDESSAAARETADSSPDDDNSSASIQLADQD